LTSPEHGPPPEELPVIELAFPGPERDQGISAILAGNKTALTGLLQILEHAGDPLPRPGERFVVVDSNGRPAVVIELTEVRVIPIGDVGDDYARAEGRGYADVAEWRAAHERLFRSAGVRDFLGEAPTIDDHTRSWLPNDSGSCDDWTAKPARNAAARR
jgi:uncharacterized protein YhfF